MSEKDIETFYYRGKWFATFEEMEKHIIDFSNEKATSDEFEYLMEQLKKKMTINFSVYEYNITNLQMDNIFEDMFLDAVRQLHKYLQKVEK